MTGDALNRLASEKSPYLLQHSHNPVDWYPWGTEAFDKAKRENKPVFLSIGYSTCHWCHVMAHESFENPRISRMINEVFVSIKVDREERPDIDMYYMSVCQFMTGSGGWPLTIIMTPEREPFFAGTYIPPETRFGRPGMMELIHNVKEIWEKNRSKAFSRASQISAALQKTEVLPGEGLDETVLHSAFQQLCDRFDEQYGGFGTEPKFPTPHYILFLLRYWKRTKNKQALEMVKKTLDAMRNGGIYDQVGSGFHRYSTDRKWLVPHFEKMLYDQALLAMAYTEAYQATGQEKYSNSAKEIFRYVLRDMTAQRGGFYSAEDADSEGKEGKFYLWTQKEIEQILSPAEATLFFKVFNFTEQGNFSDGLTREQSGENISHVTESLEKIAAEFQITSRELEGRLEIILQKLFDHRSKRVHPRKDDKILTDWNGLMIAALAKGARVFDEDNYKLAAKKAADFILQNMVTKGGRVYHRFRDNDVAVPGYLDDYTFLAYGLIELYETTFEIGYLQKALELNSQLEKHFWDKTNGGFYFVADDDKELPTRRKEIYDGAIPSGNSMAMLNLLRLSRIAVMPDLEERAIKLVKAFSKGVNEAPMGYTQLLCAVDFAIGPSYETLIAGKSGATDTQSMLKGINHLFVPNNIVVFLSEDETIDAGIKSFAPLYRSYSGIGGKATAYVCSNYNCKLPTTDLSAMLKMLE